jgi:uncharacterized protein (TIGR02246 family)
VAANNHDPDAMMLIHWNTTDYMNVGNGTIIKGWETVHNIVTSVHSNPENQSFTVDQQVVDVRVINSVTAFVVAEGKLIDVPTKDGTTTKNLALTVLLEKTDGKWVKTISHESWLSEYLFSAYLKVHFKVPNFVQNPFPYSIPPSASFRRTKKPVADKENDFYTWSLVFIKAAPCTETEDKSQLLTNVNSTI